MIQNSYIKNLGIPETTIGFEINRVFAKHNLVYLPDPKDFQTTCNMTLLKEFDDCEVTRGKISFIPLGFLEDHLGKIDVIDPLERKQRLMTILKDNFKGFDFLKSHYYKGIPLYMFRRPYLNSSLTKTVDHCRIMDKDDNLINRMIPFKIINPDTDITRNTNEWMSNTNLIPLINSYVCLTKQASYRGVMGIKIKEYLNRPFFYSELKKVFNLKPPTTERFVLFHILYRSHFTAVVIDMKTVTKDGRETKIAYFFNSCGYDPNHFELNQNYWFVDSSLAIFKHKDAFKSYQSNGRVQAPIEALTDVLLKEWGVTNFVFNMFTIQNLDSECGTFSSFFLICCLLMIKAKKKEITVATFKNIYFNMWSFGSDHLYSCLRGLFFVTSEDVQNHLYLNSPDVFPVKNEKFKTYQKIIEKSEKK